MIVGLGARVHLFVRPEYRGRFTSLFRDVLRCHVRELDFALLYPIVLVSFPDGSAFSVEFDKAAPQEPALVDDAQAFRGAWIEFHVRDVAEVQQELREAGIPEFSHAGTTHQYFVAPGGQVFRIIDLEYRGP